MRNRGLRGAWALLGLLVWLGTHGAHAQDKLIIVGTRPEVTSSYWWMPRQAGITVLLMPGGSGGIGLREGEPRSSNFLIRSRNLFAEAGFNVALMGNASDMRALNPELRQSPAHLEDMRAIVADIRQRQGGPLWLVGTSQGTVSAAAAAIGLGKDIDGLVLSATITEGRHGPGAVASQRLESLQVPVLLHHNLRDTCRITQPRQAQDLLARFSQAPVKKFLSVDGGTDPTGDPCEALHYHGYIGLESQAVQQMVEWIRQPAP